MLTAYIISAIVGGGLILLSALGGLGHHFDFDHAPGADTDDLVDFSHDTSFGGGDQHVEADGLFAGITEWIPFFSLRFWTYFFGVGGALGWVMTTFKAGVEPGILIASAIVGAVLGTIATYATRWAFRSQKNISATKNYLGAHARTLVGIRENQIGKIRVTVDDDIVDLLALSQSGGDIEAGEEVFVVGFEGDKALVMKQKEVLD